MDAKSKARFINSVAGGQAVPCPSCNNINPPGSVFCRACGTRLQAPEPEKPEVPEVPEVPQEVICPKCHTVLTPDAVFCFSCGTKITEYTVIEDDEEETAVDNKGPAFAPVHESPRRHVPKRTLNFALPEEETAVEVSVFAQGLPDWDVVPPQVLVRRVKK